MSFKNKKRVSTATITQSCTLCLPTRFLSDKWMKYFAMKNFPVLDFYISSWRTWLSCPYTCIKHNLIFRCNFPLNFRCCYYISIQCNFGKKASLPLIPSISRDNDIKSHSKRPIIRTFSLILLQQKTVVLDNPFLFRLHSTFKKELNGNKQ